jgi:hypothetical protein
MASTTNPARTAIPIASPMPDNLELERKWKAVEKIGRAGGGGVRLRLRLKWKDENGGVLRCAMQYEYALIGNWIK